MDILKKYKKADPVSKNRISTSISLDRDQARFIKKHNLNLSEFVRDCIEDLKNKIRKETENGK